MKFVVRQGKKKSAPLSPGQVVRFFEKGTFTEDAVVEDALGRQKPILEFVNRVKAATSKTVEETPGNEDVPSTEVLELEVVEDLTEEPNEVEITDFVPATFIESGVIPDTFGAADETEEILNPEWQQPPASSNATFTKQPTPNRQSPLPDCAFPGSVISKLTGYVQSKARQRKATSSGQIEGLFMVAGFVALAASVVSWIAMGSTGSILAPSALGVLGMGLLFVMTCCVHFLNVRLLQFQAQMLNPVYVCADRLIIQAVVVGVSIVTAGVLFFLGWLALSSLLMNEANWTVAALCLNGLLSLFVFSRLLHSGTSVESLGITEDPNATATQTFLASLIALLRAPLLISATLYFIGSLGFASGSVAILLTVLDFWASGRFLVPLLVPLVACCLSYSLFTTISALVGGVAIEFINAVLSIERTLREHTEPGD